MIQVRIREDLYKKLQALALAQKRSVRAQLDVILEKELKK